MILVVTNNKKKKTKKNFLTSTIIILFVSLIFIVIVLVYSSDLLSSDYWLSSSATTVICTNEKGKIIIKDDNKQQRKIIIKLDDVTNMRIKNNKIFNNLKNFTTKDHEQWFLDKPGREHYSLWHYMATLLKMTITNDDDDENNSNNNNGQHHQQQHQRHYVDIGTRYVTSSLALGSAGMPIYTFDIPESKERYKAFRNKTENEWQHKLNEVSNGVVNITFYNINLLEISHDKFNNLIMQSPMIILDTHHQPYTIPFERQFLWRLMAMKYDGLIFLDDIHLNDEMKSWWKEINETNINNQYVMYDLTSVGHFSGTGLLDFSHQVIII